MSDPFLGTWHVREHVFDPDGAFAGVVRQRRRLERLGEHRIRVFQDCEPEPALAGHPMAAFAGHHVFDVELRGDRRRYLGPAVLGAGRVVDEGAMVGRGVWPGFGYNFRSYAVMVGPDRQLTGGVFSRAGRRAAVIAGVAGPSATALEGPVWPGELARVWSGTLGTAPITRTYDGAGWRDDTDSGALEIALEPLGAGYRARGSLTGFAARYGWLLELEAVDSAAPDVAVESMEVVDPATHHLVGIQRWIAGDGPPRERVVRLRAKDGA